MSVPNAYPWQTCAQCGTQTSWTTNEYALTPNALICSRCNRTNKEASMPAFATRPSDVNADYWDYLHEGYAEHRSWKECIQFEGDSCGECEAFDAAFEYARTVETTRAQYNTAYAAAVRGYAGQSGATYQGRAGTKWERLNEYLLELAHSDAEWALTPYTPEPVTIVDADRIECGKCAGSGQFSLKTARTAETGETVPATCFPCQGKGWMSRDDQWRTNTYWAKYARVNP